MSNAHISLSTKASGPTTLVNVWFVCIPFVECEYGKNGSNSNELLEPFWFRDIVLQAVKENETVRMKIERDENQYLPIFDSRVYHLFHRGLGLAFIHYGIYAGKYARLQHKAKKSIPASLLAIECFGMCLIGLNSALGAWFGDSTYPPRLGQVFFTLLAGSGFSSSLLAGVAFGSIVSATKSLSAGAVNSFWSRNKKIVSIIAAICVMFDVLTTIGFILLWPFVELVVGGLVTLGQGIVGIIYIYQMSSFLTITSNSMADQSNSGNSLRSNKANQIKKRLNFMAKCLLVSACAMTVMTVATAMCAVSGSAMYGIYS